MKLRVVLPNVTVLTRLPASISLFITVSMEPTAVENISRSYMLQLTSLITVHVNGWNCLCTPSANDLVYYSSVKFIMNANVIVTNIVLTVYGTNVNDVPNNEKHSGE